MTKQRIKTGIKTLDDEWHGLPFGRTVILSGDAGSGKTIFALQVAYSSCAQGYKTVYLTTEESIEDLKEQAMAFDWGKTDWVAKGLLSYIDLSNRRIMEISTALDISVDIQKGNFEGILDAIPEGTQMLIIDSLVCHITRLSGPEFKERFDLLIYNLNKRNITTLIILGSATSSIYNDLAMFSAYGAFKLFKHENTYTGKRERVLDLVKMRNTKTPLHLLVFDIDNCGIVITNCLEAKVK
jgi:KaiC/GvpD/RAD55 family RecA-like ATPase